MKKHKNSVAILTLAALLFSAIYMMLSCSDAAQVAAVSETSAGPAAETGNSDEWTLFKGLPDNTYDGKNYVILAREVNIDQFFMENATGDVLDDSFYERNIKVEDTYGVTISATPINGNWDVRDQYINTIVSSVMAGDGAFNLIDGYAAIIGSVVMAGCLYDLVTVPYIMPSEVWWSSNIMEGLSVNGKVYLTPGDITTTLYDNIHAMFFNRGEVLSYNMEDPYSLVMDGRWTYDKMLSMISGIVRDLNGDNKYDKNDFFGTVLYDDLTYNNFHFAFQIPITVTGDDGYPEFNLDSEEVIGLIDTMKKLVYETEGVYNLPTKQAEATAMFKAGQCVLFPDLLGLGASLRDADIEYGVLPYPKFNEQQEGYYTTSRDGSTLFGIPTDVDDISFTGHITEALCEASYSVVIPNYYNTVLKEKYLRDTESQVMIDILRDGLSYDFGAVYAVQLERAGFLVRDCVYSNSEYASYYAKNIDKWEAALTAFVDTLK